MRNRRRVSLWAALLAIALALPLLPLASRSGLTASSSTSASHSTTASFASAATTGTALADLLPLYQLGGEDPSGQDPPGQFRAPAGVAVAPDGSVWVADTENHRLQRFTATGELLTVVGGPGSAPGRLRQPYGLDVAPDGTVWVADKGNLRLQRFAPDGRSLAAFTMPPSDDRSETPARPTDVAVAPDGTLFAATLGGVGVVHLSPDGRLLGRWLPYPPFVSYVRRGEAAIQAARPLTSVIWPYSYLDVGPDGTVYAGHSSVYRFSPDGQLLNVVASHGRGPGQVSELGPGGIEVAPDGSVIVADYGGNRVLRLLPDGTPLDAWYVAGDKGPLGLAVASDGTVFGTGAFRSNPAGGMVIRMSADGQLLDRWGLAPTVDTSVRAPARVAVGADGTVWATDLANGQLQRYAADGAFLGFVGTPGSGRGQLTSPGGLSPFPSGSMYVADTGNHRVQAFDVAGRWLRMFGSFGGGRGELSSPADVAVGRLFEYDVTTVTVADSGNHRLVYYLWPGSFYGDFRTELDGEAWSASAVDIVPSQWAGGRLARFVAVDSGRQRVLTLSLLGDGYLWSPAPGELQDPVDVAVGPEGSVAVVDASRRSVDLHHFLGRHLANVLGPDQLNHPTSVAWTPDGDLVVADPGAGRFVRTDVTGTEKAAWPAVNGADGRLEGARDVAGLPDGGWVVADANAGTVQRFSADGAFVARLETPADFNETRMWPTGVTVASDGGVFVLARSAARVRAFGPDNAFLGEWAIPAENEFDDPVDLSAAPDGSLWLLMDDPPRVQRHTPAGAVLGRWPVEPPAAPATGVLAVAALADGAVALLQGNSSHPWVVTYSPDGQVRQAWRLEFIPADIAAGPDGSILVAGYSLSEVVLAEFDPNGTPLEERRLPVLCGSSGRWSSATLRVAGGPDGRLAVSGNEQRCVQVFGAEAPGAWRATFHGNRWLAEPPLAIRQLWTEDLDLDWGTLSPAPPQVPPDGFSARFERWLTLPADGGLALDVAARGGLRLWLDDTLVVDAPMAEAVDWSGSVAAAEGPHRVRVDYSDTGAEAVLRVRVVPGAAPTPTPVPPTPTPEPPGSLHLPYAGR